jgi:hypothetical protein
VTIGRLEPEFLKDKKLQITLMGNFTLILQTFILKRPIFEVFWVILPTAVGKIPMVSKEERFRLQKNSSFTLPHQFSIG